MTVARQHLHPALLADQVRRIREVISGIANGDGHHVELMAQLAVLAPVVQPICDAVEELVDHHALACLANDASAPTKRLAALGEAALHELDLVACALAGAEAALGLERVHPFDLSRALDAPLARASEGLRELYQGLA